ncbi:hypothetical protein, partial [Acrocarpospora corrugata]
MLIQDHLEVIARTLLGLTSLECELIRERTADEHFQDSCLKAYLDWADPPFSGFSENITSRGVWGALPWWTLATKDERQQEAAMGLLIRRGANLLVDTSVYKVLDLRITEPGLGPTSIEGVYSYTLSHLPDVCELLLLARRGRVNIDVL